MKTVFIFCLLSYAVLGQPFSATELYRWEQQAKHVEIIRDRWGVPHIEGRSDADAVFGLLYAQGEDDFKRVEMNYIEKLGRSAELKGESALYNDLQIRLLIDSTKAKKDYQKAEPWLKKLLNAYADGINYFLYKNPKTKPALITRFEPWYPLLWTDGSIGAISTADLTVAELKNFYSGSHTFEANVPRDPEYQTGSNGFAFAPSVTASGKSILYINPHVTFYFRPEVHVKSAEGLNAYGAVTWGQFFVYQGFNENCGWMHTSCNVDVADMYAENIAKKDGKLMYEYDGQWRNVVEKPITIKYTENGERKSRTFVTYATHHGPIMAKRDGKWVSLRSFNRSMTSLTQSWKRTKARSFEDFKQIMNLRGNTSNSTVFADANNIALWHGNYIPVRDRSLNWSKVMDGTTSRTEWRGLHPVSETVHAYNPPNGWLQNCNSTPFTAAAANSPKRQNYPPYMAPDGENFRGINAVRVLSSQKNYTIDKVIAAGYDNYLAAFEILVPALVRSFEANVQPSDSLYAPLSEPIALLKQWDFRTNAQSVPTTLAIEWAQKLTPAIQRLYIEEGEIDQVENTKRFAATASLQQMTTPMLTVLRDLKAKFGTWRVAWGELNRFQRITDNIDSKYDDAQPSLPMGYASSLWGMLPSYNSRYYPNTQKRYGVGGNSFICAVEFGKKIKAKSLLAGGQSGHADSKHFFDQALMYTQGQFKDVLFYKEDILQQVERRYRPGQD